MRLTIVYSKIKKRNLVLINNATYQRETLTDRPIRLPLSWCIFKLTMCEYPKKSLHFNSCSDLHLSFLFLFLLFVGGRYNPCPLYDTAPYYIIIQYLLEFLGHNCRKSHSTLIYLLCKMIYNLLGLRIKVHTAMLNHMWTLAWPLVNPARLKPTRDEGKVQHLDITALHMDMDWQSFLPHESHPLKFRQVCFSKIWFCWMCKSIGLGLLNVKSHQFTKCITEV